jgi:hypothetical protein
MVAIAQTTPVSWTPVRADEVDPSSGLDSLGYSTYEVQIKSHTGLKGVESDDDIFVSVFVPDRANWDQPKVHVFFGPGNGVEKADGLTPANAGSNAVMVHGLRGSATKSDWILIGVPGRSWTSDDGKTSAEGNGFYTISDAAINQCLATAGVMGARDTYATTPTALRYSAHSRGYRGLRETIKRKLVSLVPERVVIFDAAYTSLDDALRAAAIPGPAQVAYRVTVFKDQRWDPNRTDAKKGTKGTWVDVDAKLTAAGATNIDLNADQMRAIGYSRLLADAPLCKPATPRFPGAILTLPARTTFTTHMSPPAGMTRLGGFAPTPSAAGLAAMKAFIDKNNITRFDEAMPEEIDAHHFFVAEVAHEVVD